MPEKSPYMMFALFGSLMMMMTASFVFHTPKNSVTSGIMSNIFAMNTSGYTQGQKAYTVRPEHTTALEAELGE